jgi:hypothetical protein
MQVSFCLSIPSCQSGFKIAQPSKSGLKCCKLPLTKCSKRVMLVSSQLKISGERACVAKVIAILSEIIISIIFAVRAFSHWKSAIFVYKRRPEEEREP